MLFTAAHVKRVTQASQSSQRPEISVLCGCSPPSPGRSLLSYPSNSLSRIRVKMVILSLLSSGSGSLCPTTALQEENGENDVKTLCIVPLKNYLLKWLNGDRYQLSMWIKKCEIVVSSLKQAVNQHTLINVTYFCSEMRSNLLCLWFFSHNLNLSVSDQPQALINIWMITFASVGLSYICLFLHPYLQQKTNRTERITLNLW